jgi:predicted nucleotidyltransferase
MRLGKHQLRQITNCVHKHFGRDAKLWLFGSRVDDARRGGDVDIYVETPDPSLDSELRCKVALEEMLDLHVDLIVNTHNNQDSIQKIATAQGIRL